MKLRDFLLGGTPDYYEETAERILNNYKFDHPRNIDFYELCKQYGMKITKSKTDLNCAIPANTGRKGIIVLNETDWISERQILAEEFSHLYLHQMSQFSSDEIVINKTENQAFKLAANLLIPTNWLLDIEVYPDKNEKTVLAAEVAEEFDVEPEFALRRLRLLSENYIFGKEPVALWFALYDSPRYSMPLEPIYVVLGDKKFPL